MWMKYLSIALLMLIPLVALADGFPPDSMSPHSLRAGTLRAGGLTVRGASFPQPEMAFNFDIDEDPFTDNTGNGHNASCDVTCPTHLPTGGYGSTGAIQTVDAVDEGLTQASNIDVSTTDEFTVSFHYSLNDGTTCGTDSNNWLAKFNGVFHVQCTASSNVIYLNVLGVTSGLASTATIPADSSIHHFAGVFVGDSSPKTNEVTVYIDGVVSGVPTVPVGSAALGANQSIIDLGTANEPEIMMDNYRFYTRALSASQILTISTLAVP
jgi:hypothetical protein